MERNNDHYSTLEVDQSARLPEVDSHNLPQAKLDGTPPEVIPKDVYPEVLPSTNQGEIYGLRKRTFWIALCALITTVAIGVGVGVGVGVGLNSNRSPVEGVREGSGGASGQNSSGSIASFSSLAAENYTDKQNVEHSLVYYQDSALDIWQADLDTSTDKWTLATVNTFDMDPINGTAIVALNWVNESRTDFHVRFVGANGNIRAVSVLDRMISDDWGEAHLFDNLWTVTKDSALAAYNKVCNDVCDTTTLNVFRSAKSNETAFSYRNERPDFNTSSAALNVTADDDTAYALMPRVAIPELNETYPSVALFLSAQRKLREFDFARGHGWTVGNLSLDVTVDPGAKIAAVWYTHGGLQYTQVLMTKTNGGVAMAYLDGGPENDWTYTDTVSGMEEVLSLSPITATKTGHLFALENGVNGTEIVHFQRTSVTGTPTFERVGPVSGTITA